MLYMILNLPDLALLPVGRIEPLAKILGRWTGRSPGSRILRQRLQEKGEGCVGTEWNRGGGRWVWNHFRPVLCRLRKLSLPSREPLEFPPDFGQRCSFNAAGRGSAPLPL